MDPRASSLLDVRNGKQRGQTRHTACRRHPRLVASDLGRPGVAPAVQVQAEVYADVIKQSRRQLSRMAAVAVSLSPRPGRARPAEGVSGRLTP